MSQALLSPPVITLSACPCARFGQRDGSFHFRTTILPPEDKMASVISLLAAFHEDFLRRYQ